MNYAAIAFWSEVASSFLFVVALVLIWNKYIQPAVLRAQETQNARIAEAERHRDEARAALEGLQRAIDQARQDALAMKERVSAQSEGEREALLREAREAGERALRDAQAELPRALAAAREQLRDEILEKALNTARTAAQQRIDAGTERKLVDSFVTSISAGRG